MTKIVRIPGWRISPGGEEERDIIILDWVTDQMTLVVRNQQANLPSPVESGRHA